MSCRGYWQRAAHDQTCGEVRPHWHRDTADGEELVFAAPAVPVGVHDHGPEDGAGLACNESRSPDGSLRGACLVPVGVQPEPAEGAAMLRPCTRCTTIPLCLVDRVCRKAPAVPVVHPEPGDRAVMAEDDPILLAAAGALFERWEDKRDLSRGSLAIVGEDPRTVAQVAVAAAVAAVRADTAGALCPHGNIRPDWCNECPAMVYPAEINRPKVDNAEAVSAERDVLAGQVAAIRALHRKVSEAHRFDYDHYCAVCITAPDEGVNEPWPCPTIQALDSLVASSPTTPEAKK